VAEPGWGARVGGSAPPPDYHESNLSFKKENITSNILGRIDGSVLIKVTLSLMKKNNPSNNESKYVDTRLRVPSHDAYCYIQKDSVIGDPLTRDPQHGTVEQN